MHKAIFYRDWENDYVSSIIKEAYWEKLYEPYLKKDAVVVDIGANIGLITHYCYPLASKIYAVEPSALHFETLTKMLEFNKMTDKVTPVNAAISNEDGTKTFYHNSNTTMFSLSEVVKDEKAPNGISEAVQCLTMASLFKSYGIDHVDLMKVDTEGEEFKIFSSDAFTEVCPKIDTIIVEYHAWTGISPVQLVTMLQDRGYKVTQLQTQATVFAATRI